MNKIISKEIFIKNKIKTPKFLTTQKTEFNIQKLKKNLNKKIIKFPIVVKPVNEGSSLGVKICKNIKILLRETKKLFKKYNQLILEEYIGGQEIQVAVINNSPLGAIELVPTRSFYDYKAKYTKQAKTKHIIPARLKNIMKYLKLRKKLIKF